MQFILWDPRSGYDPNRNDDGEISTNGAIGVISETNVYLTAYANYPDAKRPRHLTIGRVHP